MNQQEEDVSGEVQDEDEDNEYLIPVYSEVITKNCVNHDTTAVAMGINCN